MYKIALIAAIAKNNAIGIENKLIYWLPNDLKRFKELTTGHTIIMGSNTFRSLPKGALPNRRNIVLSRKENSFPGTETFKSLEEALANCKNEEIVYIIGGEMLYKSAMPIADILCLTEIDDTPEKADAFFPEFSKNEWEIIQDEAHKKDEKHNFEYRFVTYLRRKR
ncbi:MAG: dihydrofolate reductase [Bacteroidaceae bacterium]|nr:dihydrofolate reductase [Bacteroidaceae bacterium]